MIRPIFLTGKGEEFSLDEVMPALRHPRFLLVYATTVTATILLLMLPLASGGPRALVMTVPILVFSLVVGVVTFSLSILLAAKLMPRRRHVPLPVSLLLLAAVLLGHLCDVLLWRLLLDIPAPSWGWFVIASLLVYAANEAMSLLFVVPHFSEILRDVRLHSGKTPLPRPAAAPAQPRLVTGNQSFPLSDLLQIKAQGNYVEIWTDTASALVPGPLSALLAQVPEPMGCLVHRSEWVATRAVRSARRDGRITVLDLVNGNAVRVASTRAESVRDWLVQFGATPRRRSYSAAGGGETKRQLPPDPVTTTSAIGGTAPSAPSASVKPTKS